MIAYHSHRPWHTRRRDIEDVRLAVFVVGFVLWSMALLMLGSMVVFR